MVEFEGKIRLQTSLALSFVGVVRVSNCILLVWGGFFHQSTRLVVLHFLRIFKFCNNFVLRTLQRKLKGLVQL